MFNDLLVITKIKEGNVKAFEQLFRKYYLPLCRYAAGITGQMIIAEEIVQELFYICWKEKKQLPVFYSLKSYLYKAVRNRALQHCEHAEVQKRYQERILSGEEPVLQPETPLHLLEYKELETLMHQTLAKMHERRRRIFRLHRFEGKKQREIALMFGISVKTVEAEISKTLQLLRKELEQYNEAL